MKTLSGILFIVVIVLFGCKDKISNPDNNPDEFNDKLTLGSGLNSQNYFELIGEGHEFAINSQIYFRLESKDDMEGSPVHLKVEEFSGGAYIEFRSFPYTSPQNYGHIFLSSFSIDRAGSFRATGILDAKSKNVASIEFVIE